MAGYNIPKPSQRFCHAPVSLQELRLNFGTQFWGLAPVPFLSCYTYIHSYLDTWASPSVLLLNSSSYVTPNGPTITFKHSLKRTQKKTSSWLQQDFPVEFHRNWACSPQTLNWQFKMGLQIVICDTRESSKEWP